jgi:ribosome-associated protein
VRDRPFPARRLAWISPLPEALNIGYEIPLRKIMRTADADVYLLPEYETRKPVQKLSFTLEGEYIELNQLLKLVGICDSGGAGKMLVAQGNVSVDGQIELRKTCKIRAGQVVSLGDVRIQVIGA